MIRPDRIDHVVIKGELASDYNSSPFRPLRSRPVTAISEFPLGGKPTAGPSMVPAAAAALLHRAEQEDRMNILMVSTPATGHINPLLGVARVLIAEGHKSSACREAPFAIASKARAPDSAPSRRPRISI